MAGKEWRIYHPDSYSSGIVLGTPQNGEDLRQLADGLKDACDWLEDVAGRKDVPPLCAETVGDFPVGHVFEAAMVRMNAEEMEKAAAGALPLVSTGRPFDPRAPQLLTAEEAEAILDIDEDSFLFESASQKIETWSKEPMLSTQISGQDDSAYGWMPVADVRRMLTEIAERLETDEAETPKP